MNLSPPCRIVGAILLACAAAPALATTIRVVPDEVLVDRASIVATVRIDGQLPYAAERPATDWLVHVERIHKGHAVEGAIVIRVPGGEAPDGSFLRIHGGPEFEPGARAIVFLRPDRTPGIHRLVDFPQGAFLLGSTRTRQIAYRDFSEIRVLDRGHIGKREPVRDAVLFGEWIEARTAGTFRRPDYRVEAGAGELSSVTRPFSYRIFNNELERWFEFDRGESVTWRSAGPGVPGLGDGAAQIQQAMAAWNDEPNTPIRFVYAGAGGGTMGFTRSDGANTVLWNDPNDEMPGTYDCRGGSTLAIGGSWNNTRRSSFKGTSFREIVNGDVVVNEGVECERAFNTDFSRFLAELIAHELGHALGLGHSSETYPEPNANLRRAIMYGFALSNGPGPNLQSDDIAAIRSLYDPSVPFSRGDTGRIGIGGYCPADELCLHNGRFRVIGSWENQFDGSSGEAHPVRQSDLAGFFYFTDPSNIELIVKILDFGGEIKVFYSQLTNLRFTLRIRDVATGSVRELSNTPGDCGAIDETFPTAASSVAAAPSALESAPRAAAGTCRPGPTTLCLQSNRFAVDVDWRNQFSGASGKGAPKSLTQLTGAFSFDDPANLEILLKILEFDGKVLVLWGSLSNFEYSIRITDTLSGAVKTYENPAGTFCGGLDNDAF